MRWNAYFSHLPIMVTRLSHLRYLEISLNLSTSSNSSVFSLPSLVPTGKPSPTSVKHAPSPPLQHKPSQYRNCNTIRPINPMPIPLHYQLISAPSQPPSSKTFIHQLPQSLSLPKAILSRLSKIKQSQHTILIQLRLDHFPLPPALFLIGPRVWKELWLLWARKYHMLLFGKMRLCWCLEGRRYRIFLTSGNIDFWWLEGGGLRGIAGGC
jgi:hypothetical protein